MPLPGLAGPRALASPQEREPMTVRDRIALAVGGLGLLAVCAAGVLLVGGLPDAGDPLSSDPFADLASAASGTPPPTGLLVVDVEGAVSRPGIVRLPAGARVADAIAAAGGYSAEVDLVAAMQTVNLAGAVSDGQQIVVPIIGVAGGSGGGGGGSGGGLVNLNLASAEALDALPGIGPVTIAKILAARQESPFQTLEELVERDVMTNAQLEDIRDLVTLG